ncbi:hypothetical protein DFS34DRAFT_652287 [Phlyctochytrium arcticum]|nr:hypothetical protein DFS34DRAFT_652287 [Phlyctochytrium arcticum]
MADTVARHISLVNNIIDQLARETQTLVATFQKHSASRSAESISNLSSQWQTIQALTTSLNVSLDPATGRAKVAEEFRQHTEALRQVVVQVVDGQGDLKLHEYNFPFCILRLLTAIKHVVKLHIEHVLESQREGDASPVAGPVGGTDSEGKIDASKDREGPGAQQPPRGFERQAPSIPTVETSSLNEERPHQQALSVTASLNESDISTVTTAHIASPTFAAAQNDASPAFRNETVELRDKKQSESEQGPEEKPTPKSPNVEHAKGNLSNENEGKKSTRASVRNSTEKIKGIFRMESFPVAGETLEVVAPVDVPVASQERRESAAQALEAVAARLDYILDSETKVVTGNKSPPIPSLTRKPLRSLSSSRVSSVEDLKDVVEPRVQDTEKVASHPAAAIGPHLERPSLTTSEASAENTQGQNSPKMAAASLKDSDSERPSLAKSSITSRETSAPFKDDMGVPRNEYVQEQESMVAPNLELETMATCDSSVSETDSQNVPTPLPLAKAGKFSEEKASIPQLSTARPVAITSPRLDADNPTGRVTQRMAPTVNTKFGIGTATSEARAKIISQQQSQPQVQSQAPLQVHRQHAQTASAQPSPLTAKFGNLRPAFRDASPGPSPVTATPEPSDPAAAAKAKKAKNRASLLYVPSVRRAAEFFESKINEETESANQLKARPMSRSSARSGSRQSPASGGFSERQEDQLSSPAFSAFLAEDPSENDESSSMGNYDSDTGPTPQAQSTQHADSTHQFTIAEQDEDSSSAPVSRKASMKSSNDQSGQGSSSLDFRKGSVKAGESSQEGSPSSFLRKSSVQEGSPSSFLRKGSVTGKDQVSQVGSPPSFLRKSSTAGKDQSAVEQSPSSLRRVLPAREDEQQPISRKQSLRETSTTNDGTANNSRNPSTTSKDASWQGGSPSIGRKISLAQERESLSSRKSSLKEVVPSRVNDSHAPQNSQDQFETAYTPSQNIQETIVSNQPGSSTLLPPLGDTSVDQDAPQGYGNTDDGLEESETKEEEPAEMIGKDDSDMDSDSAVETGRGDIQLPAVTNDAYYDASLIDSEQEDAPTQSDHQNGEKDRQESLSPENTESQWGPVTERKESLQTTVPAVPDEPDASVSFAQPLSDVTEDIHNAPSSSQSASTSAAKPEEMADALAQTSPDYVAEEPREHAEAEAEGRGRKSGGSRPSVGELTEGSYDNQHAEPLGTVHREPDSTRIAARDPRLLGLTKDTQFGMSTATLEGDDKAEISLPEHINESDEEGDESTEESTRRVEEMLDSLRALSHRASIGSKDAKNVAKSRGRPLSSNELVDAQQGSNGQSRVLSELLEGYRISTTSIQGDSAPPTVDAGIQSTTDRTNQSGSRKSSLLGQSEQSSHVEDNASRAVKNVEESHLEKPSASQTSEAHLAPTDVGRQVHDSIEAERSVQGSRRPSRQSVQKHSQVIDTALKALERLSMSLAVPLGLGDLEFPAESNDYGSTDQLDDQAATTAKQPSTSHNDAAEEVLPTQVVGPDTIEAGKSEQPQASIGGSPIPNAVLMPMNNQFPVQTLNLATPYRLGRGNPRENFKSFASQVVSRNHCDIFAKDGKIFIQDCGSNSGTFLNGVRMSDAGVKSSSVELKSGDYVQLGKDYEGAAVNNLPEARRRCIKMQIVILSLDGQPIPSEQVGSKLTKSHGDMGSGTVKISESLAAAASRNQRSPSSTTHPNETSQIGGRDSSSVAPANQPVREVTLERPGRSDVARNSMLDDSSLKVIRDPTIPRIKYHLTISGTKEKVRKVQLMSDDSKDLMIIGLKFWDTKRVITIQDLRPIWGAQNPSVEIFPDPASKPSDPVATTPFIVTTATGAGMGTLKWASKFKLTLDPAQESNPSAASTPLMQGRAREAVKTPPAEPSPTPPSFSLSGDLLQQKYILVSRNPQSREQRSIGEAWGKNLVRKSVRENRWAVSFELEDGPFGQLCIAGIIFACVSSNVIA